MERAAASQRSSTFTWNLQNVEIGYNEAGPGANLLFVTNYYGIFIDRRARASSSWCVEMFGEG